MFALPWGYDIFRKIKRTSDRQLFGEVDAQRTGNKDTFQL